MAQNPGGLIMLRSAFCDLTSDWSGYVCSKWRFTLALILVYIILVLPRLYLNHDRKEAAPVKIEALRQVSYHNGSGSVWDGFWVWTRTATRFSSASTRIRSRYFPGYLGSVVLEAGSVQGPRSWRVERRIWQLAVWRRLFQ